MTSEKATLLFVLLLIISLASADSLYQSAFTKEIRLQKLTEPFKVNNKLLFCDGYTLTSAEPGAMEYVISFFNIDMTPKSILNLGNGKLLFTSYYAAFFLIANEEDYSPGSKAIPYDKDVKSKTEATSVVAYDDATFDIFDRRQEVCMPCRYNDKGERLPVEHTLEKEPNYKEYEPYPLMYYQYSLELVKDGFGVENGYFYVYRYANGTTALRILDSKFKLVKQRLFTATVEAHSLTGENLTICYRRNVDVRHFVECHLLNVDFKTIADVQLHEIEDEGITDLKVQNLADGGAMVAMLFTDGRSRRSVYVQRIRPGGRVNPPIQYSSKAEDLLDMHDFTFDNGEYCLVTINGVAKDRYTVVKCLTTV